jgi:hypothetical protein
VRELLTVTDRIDAKGVEQVLIERLPGLENIYNSIAPSNPIYGEATRRGLEIFQRSGYRFPPE